MRYEVEQKHRVDDVASLIGRLAEHGATPGAPLVQADRYFAHPCRDFASTDEALRIRSIGDRSFVTYKGPRIDSVTKTRRELELPLAVDDVDGLQFAELLQAIGFAPVAVVHKTRRSFTIHYAGREVQGTYDLVDKVGAFIELELVVDETELEQAKRIIAELANKLDLGPSVTRSYLEMLLHGP